MNLCGKKLLFIFLFIRIGAFSEVTESVRKEYATKLYEAFVLQSQGKSTQAFYALQNGFQQGTNAGESSIKLQVIADLFYWYRRYGHHLKLFTIMPSGNEVITDQYNGKNCHRSKYNRSVLFGAKHRTSEWGNDPHQARRIQDFMFGMGELISGIFIVVVMPESLLFVGGGTGLITHGIYTIKESLHDLWTEHQIELFELEKLSQRASQTSE